MNAPEGMGMVVDTADIQNYSREANKATLNITQPSHTYMGTAYRIDRLMQAYTHTIIFHRTNKDFLKKAYFHDEEEQQDEEDADVGVQPGGGAAQPRGERRRVDLGPGEVIKQGVDALPGHELQGHTSLSSLKLI